MSYMISQSLLPEFDMEMASTRKVLERVPASERAYRPHAKSFTLGRLAGHVAEMPVWAAMTLAQDHLEMSPDEPTYAAHVLESTPETVAFFDENVRQARALLAAATDETMMRPWTLTNKGETVFSMPKVAVFRSFVMNHMIHHRAQLGVYLRLNDVAVPGLYGPSADEQ